MNYQMFILKCGFVYSRDVDGLIQISQISQTTEVVFEMWLWKRWKRLVGKQKSVIENYCTESMKLNVSSVRLDSENTDDWVMFCDVMCCDCRCTRRMSDWQAK